MDAPADPTAAARTTITALLHGAPPNGIRPDDCGAWRDVVAALHEAYADDGTTAVRRTYDLLARTTPALIALVAGAEDAAEPAERPARGAAPALPDAARAIEAHAAPCGAWLDAYVAYAAQAAPMAPASFHEAAGLFAAALAVARRLCARSDAVTLYPNLYVAYVAESGIYTKTSALKVMLDVLARAGLRHLLLPAKLTPEALVDKMSVGLVDDKLPEHKLLRLLREKAFAAQRGWVVEEVSSLFGSLEREFNKSMKELLLSLYDGTNYDASTITRGDSEVRDPYLSFFGVSTPMLMGPHFANQEHWASGLWSRFIPLVPRPDEPPVWREPTGVREAPAEVVAGLRRVYELFPRPEADIVADEEKGIRWVEVTGMPAPLEATFEPAAWAAWHAYRKATTYDLLRGGAVEPVLASSYSRFGTQLVKVALLLAAMDAEPESGVVLVRAAHVARAQQIVERWRATLHHIHAEQGLTAETQLMQRIQRQLQRAEGGGMTVRDLCMRLRATAREVGEALDILRRAGRVAGVQARAKNGRDIEVWQCISSS
jgi:hypothetical protein